MQVIYEPRGSGKTAKLIKMASERWGYIVCHSQKRAHEIFWHARDRGIDINFPITYREFKEGRHRQNGAREFYLDDVDMYLQSLTTKPIVAIALTKEEPPVWSGKVELSES